jgi:GT2 family glycosyltransferase
MSDPFVSVIVLGWGGERFISGCMQALSCQTYPAYEIIVVDNASPDQTASIVEAQFPHVRLLRTKKNLGVAGGNNVGLRAARGDILILTNVDTEARPDWISTLVNAIQSDPTIGIAGSKLLYPDGRIQYGGGEIDRIQGFPLHLGAKNPDNPPDTEIRDTDYATGAALALRREVLEQIGYEDEAYFPIDYEDPDLCFRARLAGWRVCYVPAAVSIHFESSTTQSLAPHRIMSSLMGRLRFVCKFWPDEQLRNTFVDAECRWLESLKVQLNQLASFIYGVMPTLYFKTLTNIEDLAEWREEVGISTRAESRKTLAEVLNHLRTVSLPSFQPQGSVGLPRLPSNAVTGILEEWFVGKHRPLQETDTLLLESILAMSATHLQVQTGCGDLTQPHWPNGPRAKMRSFMQKLGHRLVRSFVDPIIAKQNEINVGLLQVLSLMSQEIYFMQREAAFMKDDPPHSQVGPLSRRP